MGIGKRMVKLVWLGSIPLFLGLVFHASVSLFIVYNGVLAGVYLLDRMLSPKPGDFKVERSHERVLEMGRENSILLRVYADTKGDTAIDLRDTVPFDMEQVSGTLFPVTCRVGMPGEAVYRIIPKKRGKYSFGAVHVRYLGVLGLYRGQFHADLSEEIRVYPDLHPLKRIRLAARKNQVLEHGRKAHQVTGIGTDFQGLREYTTDDEFRKINWSASARSHKLITNVYDVEKSQNVIIAIDMGRVMMAANKGMSRLDHAVNGALALAGVAIDRGDKVGLVVFSNEIKVFLKPGKGDGQMEKILHHIYGLQPEFYESDFRELASYMGVYQRKRSMICIFSQMEDEESCREMAADLSTLKEKHALIFVSLLNPGLYEMLDTYTENLETAYTKAAAVHRLSSQLHMGTRLTALGIGNIITSPDRLTPDVIYRYTAMKKQMKV